MVVMQIASDRGAERWHLTEWIDFPGTCGPCISTLENNCHHVDPPTTATRATPNQTNIACEPDETAPNTVLTNRPPPRIESVVFVPDADHSGTPSV